jgi:two-component system, chemotaxis family, CheB/CheR fusion protein
MQLAPSPPCVDFLVAQYQLPPNRFSYGGADIPTQRAETGDAPARDKNRPRALVVDDAPDVTEMIATFLQHAGFDAVMAFSAPEALEAARVERFQVVISDIGMPGMNGYDLAIALRALPEYSNVPMIAVTGFSVYDDKGRALQSGFNAHMTKPINPMSLLDLIKSLGE